jgi:hypothetical protein
MGSVYSRTACSTTAEKTAAARVPRDHDAADEAAKVTTELTPER